MLTASENIPITTINKANIANIFNLYRGCDTQNNVPPPNTHILTPRTLWMLPYVVRDFAGVIKDLNR